jgi:asparagine synthase (glutamine-hydrolysing)
MCGFLAICQSSPIFGRHAAEAAAESIAHRGPDGSGQWHERQVMLFHRRLAIIDLATGQQPMLSSNGRYVIAFNGEIYNFQELREELREKGSRFRTNSDTEVLLEGYCYWGQ